MLDVIDVECCNYCQWPYVFSSKFQSAMTIFHCIKLCGDAKYTKLCKVVHYKIVSWDDNTCILVHEKCQQFNYYINIVTIGH